VPSGSSTRHASCAYSLSAAVQMYTSQLQGGSHRVEQ
jgi:hypothetical protein